jgi:GT2 family glycosyltransferase
MINASIVIPTYKRLNLALNLARSIHKFYPDIEIIIVDQENNNPPKKIEVSGVKYFNLKKANTSAAKNLGWQKNRGEVVIFFDDDVEITKETIEQHIRAYQDKNVVATAGRVIYDGEKVPRNTNIDTGRTNLLGTKFSYLFWSTKKQNVDFPYGCNMSFRKSILEKVKGFDEKFPKIFEEVDLGYRVKKYGQIKFVPDALVYHHKAKTGGIRPEEKLNKEKLIFENYGRYLAKNICFPLSFFSLLIRTVTALKIDRKIGGNLWKGYFGKIKYQSAKIKD